MVNHLLKQRKKIPKFFFYLVNKKITKKIPGKFFFSFVTQDDYITFEKKFRPMGAVDSTSAS